MYCIYDYDSSPPVTAPLRRVAIDSTFSLSVISSRLRISEISFWTLGIWATAYSKANELLEVGSSEEDWSMKIRYRTLKTVSYLEMCKTFVRRILLRCQTFLFVLFSDKQHNSKVYDKKDMPS